MIKETDKEKLILPLIIPFSFFRVCVWFYFVFLCLYTCTPMRSNCSDNGIHFICVSQNKTIESIENIDYAIRKRLFVYFYDYRW